MRRCHRPGPCPGAWHLACFGHREFGESRRSSRPQRDMPAACILFACITGGRYRRIRARCAAGCRGPRGASRSQRGLQQAGARRCQQHPRTAEPLLMRPPPGERRPRPPPLLHAKPKGAPSGGQRAAAPYPAPHLRGAPRPTPPARPAASPSCRGSPAVGSAVQAMWAAAAAQRAAAAAAVSAARRQATASAGRPRPPQGPPTRYSGEE
jgi:hypothetical protein